MQGAAVSMWQSLIAPVSLVPADMWAPPGTTLPLHRLVRWDQTGRLCSELAVLEISGKVLIAPSSLLGGRREEIKEQL